MGLYWLITLTPCGKIRKKGRRFYTRKKEYIMENFRWEFRCIRIT